MCTTACKSFWMHANLCICVSWLERQMEEANQHRDKSTRSFLNCLVNFPSCTDLRFSSKLLLTYKKSNSCTDDWNVILLRCGQFFVPSHLFKFPRASVGTVGFGNECTHVLPVLCTLCPLAGRGPFHLSAKRPGSRQKNKRLVAAVQSWSNLHRHLAWLTLASISRLCFWVTQLILFTNNSFCSTLRVSQRERDHYKPERPHRANFTFDYGPSAGFSLNQRELWNRGSAVSTGKKKKKTAFVFSRCPGLEYAFSFNWVSAMGVKSLGQVSHFELEVCSSFKCLKI